MQHVPSRKLIHGAAIVAAAMAALPSHYDPRVPGGVYTRDEVMTFDQATIDSAGAFLIGQLEAFDPMIHEPLASVTWYRDIDLRSDVQPGHTSTSFTTQTFAAVGGTAPSGIAWASPNGTTIPRITVDKQKLTYDLTPWAMELSYTVMELASSSLAGTNIDTEQLIGLNLKDQMDTDQMVYIGDSSVGAKGILNHALVANLSNVANNAAGTSRAWTAKTPDEILADFNEMIISVWAATGFTTPPQNILIAPNPYGYITTVKIGSAGNRSVLDYLMENNVFTKTTKKQLEILPCKWLDKNNINGPGGSAATYDRMIAYTRDTKFVRFPKVPLSSLPAQPSSIWIKVPYWGKLGRVEIVYPETFAYRDGIG